jgi:hypothetical protein
MNSRVARFTRIKESSSIIDRIFGFYTTGEGEIAFFAIFKLFQI